MKKILAGLLAVALLSISSICAFADNDSRFVSIRPIEITEQMRAHILAQTGIDVHSVDAQLRAACIHDWCAWRTISEYYEFNTNIFNTDVCANVIREQYRYCFKCNDAQARDYIEYDVPHSWKNILGGKECRACGMEVVNAK